MIEKKNQENAASLHTEIDELCSVIVQHNEYSQKMQLLFRLMHSPYSSQLSIISYSVKEKSLCVLFVSWSNIDFDCLLNDLT